MNYCENAAAILGYSDPNCVSQSATIDQMIEKWLVNTKTVTRYYDADTFAEGEGLQYRQAQLQTGYFDQQLSRVGQMDFKVHQTLNY